MAMLKSHPAAGIEPMVPGVVSDQRARRPSMGEMVPAMFVMPQNPLVKSVMSVNGYPTAGIGCTEALHGMGDFEVFGTTFTTTDLITYAAYAVGAFMLYHMASKALKPSRHSSGKLKISGTATETPGLLD